jgi:2-C-methyl-D-erythritol 4-phosphate cytidylyltransferase
MTHAIVTAAGKGIRFGDKKTLHLLNGKPLLSWSLRVLEEAPEITDVIVTFPADDSAEAYKRICEVNNYKKVRFVAGGDTRYDSVRNAFFSLKDPQGIILIHDAARPLLSRELLLRVLVAAEKHGAAVPVLPISETVKEIEGEMIVRTLPREKLFVAQTPQGFRVELLAEAYGKIKDSNVTDEAMLVEMAGYSVHAVAGDHRNLKITERSDIRVAEIYL